MERHIVHQQTNYATGELTKNHDGVGVLKVVKMV